MSVQVQKPALFSLAPMAELSHRALRELIEAFIGGKYPPCFQPRPKPAVYGAGLPAPPSAGQLKPAFGPAAPRLLLPVYFTEMISAAGLLSGGPLEKWYLDGGPCPERLVYQLLGADPGKIAGAAAILDRRECLGIDLNMGCAAPAITRSGAGVRLMEDPDLAGRIVRAVRKTTTKRLSVKLRLGPKNRGRRTPPDAGPARAVEELPGFEYLLAFCRRLVEEGLDFITLHPRGAAEKFKGRARWDYVAALRRELPIPVAGNGDIQGSEAMIQRAREGPVMTGRAAVRQPWIFAAALESGGLPEAGPERPAAVPSSENAPARAAPPAASLEAGPETAPGAGGPPAGTAPAETPAALPPDTAFLEETALRFLDLLSRHQPPEFHLSRARRFFHYYCDNFTWAEHLRNLINRETNLSGIGRVLRDYCRENAAPGGAFTAAY